LERAYFSRLSTDGRAAFSCRKISEGVMALQRVRSSSSERFEPTTFTHRASHRQAGANEGEERWPADIHARTNPRIVSGTT